MKKLLVFVASMAALSMVAGTYGGIGNGINPVQRVVIYGDSMSDDSVSAASCDWCAPLVDSGVEIWNAATGGARTYDDDETDPAACETATYDGCHFYVEHQMTRHPDASGCQVGTATSANGGSAANTPLYGGAGEVLTCLEDINVNEHTTVVIYAGSNDVARVNHTAFTSTYFALSKAAYQRMLGAVKDAGTACVIVIPPYQWDHATVTYTDINENLSDFADYLDGTAVTSIADDMGGDYPTQCVFVDAREFVDDYTASHGFQTMLDDIYADCNGLGDDGSASGCLHFSAAGSELLGKRIAEGIRKARQAAIAMVEEADSGSSLWGSLIWDTDDWG